MFASSTGFFNASLLFKIRYNICIAQNIYYIEKPPYTEERILFYRAYVRVYELMTIWARWQPVPPSLPPFCSNFKLHFCEEKYFFWYVKKHSFCSTTYVLAVMNDEEEDIFLSHRGRNLKYFFACIFSKKICSYRISPFMRKNPLFFFFSLLLFHRDKRPTNGFCNPCNL